MGIFVRFLYINFHSRSSFLDYAGLRVKEKHMKEIIVSSYYKRIRKLLKLARNGQNLILAFNVWALPLIFYTAWILKWSLCELKQLDISTRKLLALYRCFNTNDDVKRLYASRQSGGCGSLSVEDTVLHECLSLSKNLACNQEPLLQQVFQSSQWSSPPESPSKFKATRKQDHYDAWKEKSLPGQFSRVTDSCIDVSQQWKWLSNSNPKKETEGLIMAAQNQAITTNSIKVNIFTRLDLPNVIFVNVMLIQLITF